MIKKKKKERKCIILCKQALPNYEHDEDENIEIKQQREEC